MKKMEAQCRRILCVKKRTCLRSSIPQVREGNDVYGVLLGARKWYDCF